MLHKLIKAKDKVCFMQLDRDILELKDKITDNKKAHYKLHLSIKGVSPADDILDTLTQVVDHDK